MICGICGRRMTPGRFTVNASRLSSFDPVTIKWFEGDELVCQTKQDKTIGFFCAHCSVLIGVFQRVEQVGFTSEFNQDLDDKIDSLPKKNCPECGLELDIDYPRCPECGFIF